MSPVKNQTHQFVESTAVVTGGLGILGKTICENFAKYGVNLIIADLENDEGNAFAEYLISKYRIQANFKSVDLTKEDSVAQLSKYCFSQSIKPNIVINNAASKGKNLNEFFAPFNDFSLSTWKEIQAVNVDGVFLMCKHFGQEMINHSIEGNFVQISSIYGILAPDQRIYEGSEYEGRPINTPCVYSATKASVVGITKYLSTYWASHNIRVNCVTPGGIESGQNTIFQKNYSKRVPLNRMAQADEIAQGVLFLASPSSSYITGQNLIIDGGLSVW